MANMVDVVNDDAFSVTNLTEAFIEMDHVPGRAGELVFGGVGRGLQTLTASFEYMADTISLIPSQSRGAPAYPQDRKKRQLTSVSIPHFPLDDRIHASEVIGIRQMGTEDAVMAVQQLLDSQLMTIGARHDMTAENLRMGALLGKLYDSDGAVLVDWFTTFGKSEPTPFNFALTTSSTDVRAKCAEVIRAMKRDVKTTLPGNARVHAFCGDNFFDALIGHPEVKAAFDGYAAAERRLAESYVEGQYGFGGIIFENYRGSDAVDADANTEDGGAVGIDPDEARFFWTGIPGLYAEYYAPGDFTDQAGGVGLPRYVSVAADPMHGRFLDVHTEMNPLPVCTRPLSLKKATKA
ncbi:MAG: major capsid protein [Pseudomonadota bacterium]